MAITTAQVQQLYVAYLGRAADKAGLDYWMAGLNAATPTLTLDDLRVNFVNDQPEYAAAYGGLDRSAQVTKIYENLFNRAPDAEGLAYWTTGGGATVTPDLLLTAFINGAAASDATVVGNKVFVAQTYTDTVGADFNAGAAASVIANVDGTPASVSAALSAIGNGTLEGQVPGVAQIEALATAQAAVTTFEAANKATADALVAKIDAQNTAAGVDPTTTATDDITTSSSYQDKVDAVVADATLARGAIVGSTSVLAADAGDKAAAVATDYKALTTAEKALADKYVAAIAAEATAKAGAATATEQGSAIGGLDKDASAAAALADHGTASELYDEYVAATPDARTAIDAEFKDSSFYASFKQVVAKDAAYADAIKATLAAADSLDNDGVVSTTTVTIHGAAVVADAGTDTTGSVAGNTYVNALAAKTLADTTLAAAKAADADLASATALKDAYAVQTGAVQSAQAKIDAVDVAGKVATHDLDGSDTAGTGTVAAPIKDVFYFGDKSVTANSANDFSITSFAAGDSIVLGSNSYTYNSGALSTGDNNKLEFFLVKSDTGLQVVLETAAYGSSDVKTDATTGVVTSGAADHAAVITLTGVAAADVTVANGVITHVA